MKVCIGITTKNRGGILPKAIDSALSQSYANKEVMVFDDGSTDSTLSLPEQYSNVTWLRKNESIGLLAARNEMMRTCEADLFVSLDDDAWFLVGDEIALAVDIMETKSDIGAISFDVLQNDTKRFNKVERDGEVESNVFIGCGHMLRLSAVKEVGFYIPFPVNYGHEEKDLCIRLIDKDYRILFLPGVHVWHDYTTVERNVADQRRSFIINDLVFPFRRVPLQYILPVLANNIFRKLRSKQDDPVLTRKAIWSFFKLIPDQLKYVDRVQSKSYLKYRSTSKRFLKYLADNDQNL